MDVLAFWNCPKRLFSGQKSPIYRDLSIQGSAFKRKAVGSNPARDAKNAEKHWFFQVSSALFFYALAKN